LTDVRISIQVNKKYINRYDGTWIEFKDKGNEFLDKEHKYSSDLDIFGSKSLFQLINSTRTTLGRKRLANLLKSGKRSKEEIVNRQRAVEEISEKIDFCQNIASPSEQYKGEDGSKELIDFLILSLLAFIPTNGFPLLLADKLPDEEVGILAVCFRIALLINFIVTIVNSIAMPKFSVSYKKEGGELHKYYKKYNLFLWVTCFPILLFIMCFNSMILSFFSVDEGFEWVLIIMVLGQLINILTGNVTALLNMIGLQRLNRNITIFSSLFAVLSLYILSGYGIYFAAMSVSLYWGLKNFISAFYIWKHVGINCFKVT